MITVNNTYLCETDTLYCPSCFNDTDNCTCFDDWDYPECPQLHRQSAEITTPEGSGDVEVVQTTVFADETAGLQEVIEFQDDPMSTLDQQNIADLKDFLGRPVRINSFTWNETDLEDATLQTIQPWSLFFNEARIKNKIANFAFLRCTLKVKVMVNASPFYYGCMGVAYQPLQNFTVSTIKSTGPSALIPISQRPILWVYPQESKGGELTLPFFNHRNWLDIDRLAAFTNMGELNYYPFTSLRSANGAVGQGVTIQTYAWAEDVQLSGATVGLTLQSKPFTVQDEYGLGPISAPATTVANLARNFKKMENPFVRKFATATEIGASAVAGIAKIFGYTNVPVIEDTKPYRPGAFPQFASPEISFPVEKLTLDPKNELTIDPSVVGAPPGDPLSIASLVSRESFETKLTWSTTNAVDDLLYTSDVSPLRYFSTSNLINSTVDWTPMGMVARLFNNWRGDIIFRFKVVASPYHKGRLIVAFDPQGNATNLFNSTNTTSAVYTAIIDLGESQDVELRVPFVQATAFLKTQLSTVVGNVPWRTSAFSFTAHDDIDNGFLTMRVLTRLTAPVATAPVQILVYTRGSEEMEFANPRYGDSEFSTFVTQAQEFSLEEQTCHELGAATGPVPLEQFRVNFGEVVKSLRVLLHRHNYVYSQGDETIPGTAYAVIQSTFGKLPPFRGFDPTGIHRANNIVGVGNSNYNFVQDSIVQWMLPAFVAYRGSGVWTFNTNSAAAVGSVTVTRDNETQMNWSDTASAGFPVLGNRSGVAAFFNTNRTATAAGVAATNQLTQAGLSVLCPNYNYLKFNSTTPGNMTSAPTSSSYNTYDGSTNDAFKLNIMANNVNSSTVNGAGIVVDKYWCAGPDFQLLFFLNAPTWYRTQAATPF